MVDTTLNHLKEGLIPKLKQIDKAVQKRNIWLECCDRNRHQNAVYEAENARVHQIIVQEKEKIVSTKEQARKNSNDVMDKACEL